ncbi:unnamed protein product [Withania somnifera]
MWTINAACKRNRTNFPKVLDYFGRNPTCLTTSNRKLCQNLKPNPAYNVIILGSSGFTGKHVIREALKFLNTKIILNCVDPFRLYGEPVVEACADSGCDYLDICGEPEFMERMEVKYHDKSKESGSLVVSACGFDSVPAELGWMFNSRQWMPPAVCSNIEAYVSLESDKRIVGNLGAYESAVLSIPGTSTKGPVVNHLEKIGLWGVKLPLADATVVRRTLSCLAEDPRGLSGISESTEQIERRKAFWSTIKPAHFGMKIASKSLLGVVRFITVGKFIALFGKTGIGRWLLLNFPSVFSLGYFRKKGPTEDEVASATFKMWFVVPLLCSGNETIFQKKRRCFPPGIVFGPTDLQDRLQQNGIYFDVISKQVV